MTPDFVEVAPNIFVGNRTACDIYRTNFNKVVHIWRNDHEPVIDHQCYTVRMGNVPAKDLAICYADGRSLVTQSQPALPAIEEYLAKVLPSETLLIHCMAGQTRSNTIALVVLLQRGVPLGVALELIIVRQWSHRKIMPNLCITPLEDILNHFGY